MADAYRLNLTLDDAHAEKLRRRAAASHLKEGTLARSLLSTVLDQLDEVAPSPSPTVVELLDGIPGALERAERGRAQGRSGQATPLDRW
jgi:hypothetical protein